MSLTETLANKNAESRARIPSEALEIMDRATNSLKDAHILNNAIKVNDTFPNAVLKNINGDNKGIDSLKGEKATIISFYRGGWCPYCNIELQALQTALPEFNELGANLIAITPETPDNSLSTSEKNALSFEVLSDIDNTFAREIGLVFKMPKELQEVYSKFGIDVKKHNQNDDYELPIAATFVIDNNNAVKYVYTNEDYTKRADINEIKSAIKSL
ncbi:peroxiredoxin-like family protein [uncultured Algibacter sp.]|uniref:peroxiredoxin-like family protein n=1 Tax=uncultured Algibacter sp. TaxID=298659 RepID=UPI0032167771